MDSYTITEKFLIQIFFAPFVSVLVNGKKKGGAHDKPWTPIDQVWSLSLDKSYRVIFFTGTP